MSRLTIPPGYAKRKRVRDDSRYRRLVDELTDDAEQLDAAPALDPAAER